MKIVQLIAENVKKLKAVAITPDGNTVMITGKNEQGKTSVLDAIWLALQGKEASKEVPRPIRRGEQTARVSLDLGDIVVSRNWTSNDQSYLKVENKDGARYPSPQAMLDKLVGRLSFDPLEFTHMKPDEQTRTLQELAGYNPALLDAKRKALFDERTVANREIKRLEGALTSIPEPQEGLPEKEISAAEVLKESQEAQRQKQANDAKRQQLQNLAREKNAATEAITSTEGEIKRLQGVLQEQKQALESINEKGKALKAEVAALADPDLDSYQQRLNEVESTNTAIRQAARRCGVAAELSEAKHQSEALTAQIAAVDTEKEAALKAAAMPIDGLGFDEYGVCYNGIPFKQCSGAERLRVSLAMAMALNPKLRVIRINDGSLLDSTNLALIGEVAKAADYQVWIEKVDETGRVGIVIEDGAVVAVNPARQMTLAD